MDLAGVSTGLKHRSTNLIAIISVHLVFTFKQYILTMFKVITLDLDADRQKILMRRIPTHIKSFVVKHETTIKLGFREGN